MFLRKYIKLLEGFFWGGVKSFLSLFFFFLADDYWFPIGKKKLPTTLSSSFAKAVNCMT